MIEIQAKASSADLNELLSAIINISDGKTLSSTAGAARNSASLLQRVWKEYANGGSLPGIPSLKNPSIGYAKSIKVISNGPFDYEIVSDADIAKRLEEGTNSYDMKVTHTKGPKSRVSKKGIPYLIIPFRWGEKKGGHFRNIIPEEIVRLISSKNFKRSKVLSTTHNEPNFKGEDVQRREYEWGDRITEADTNDDRAVGMVNMGNKSGRFTFRIISAASPAGSWINPGITARPVAQTVANETLPAIKIMITNALKKDLGL